MSDLTSLGFEPQTSSTDSIVLTAELTGGLKKSKTNTKKVTKNTKIITSLHSQTEIVQFVSLAYEIVIRNPYLIYRPGMSDAVKFCSSSYVNVEHFMSGYNIFIRAM